MHRDVETLHETKELFDGLVMPAHILAYQKTSASVFITSLPKHKYLVDPMTGLFMHRAEAFRNEEGVLRPSLRSLCEAYHPKLVSVLDGLDDDEYITPHILPLEEFSAGVLEFQRTAVASGSTGGKAEKYLKRKGYKGAKATNPRSLVAPYFMFRTVGDGWYRTNVGALSHCRKQVRSGEELAAVIHCPCAALTSSGTIQLADHFGQADRLLIWLEDFNQHSASSGDIIAVRKAIALLSKVRPVEVLFGGYLLAMTNPDGTQAFSHGILFTEHRSAEATPGGGGVPERYYIPAFHQFRSLSQTDLILHKFPSLLCTCPVCRDVLAGNPDNFIKFEDEPEKLRKHFLWVRKAERDSVSTKSSKKLAEELRLAHSKYHDGIVSLPNPDAFVSETRMRGLDYLLEWAKGIEST